MPAPLCTPIPTQGTPDFRYLSGGDGVAIFYWPHPSNPSEVRLWVSEDGGRIRYSADHGTNWIYQETPFPAAQKLLDISFLGDGETGWACGLGGRLLKTLNHGDTWSFANPSRPTLFDGFGKPAALWSARFLNGQLGFLAGKYSFNFTTDGAQSWLPIELYSDASLSPDTRLDPTLKQFEFYVVRVIGTPTQWVGFAGAQWKRPRPGAQSARLASGVLFRGQSDVAGGVKWWKILEDGIMQEPWDIEFQDPMNGFLVGGTGAVNGKIFHTIDGGTIWSEEGPAANGPFLALYGVAAQGGGKAIACGYGGQIWVRDLSLPVPGSWVSRSVPGFTAPLTDAAALLNTPEAWIVGSTGFVRRTQDSGDTWLSLNHGELQFRGKDLHLVNRGEAVVVGQRAPGEVHGLVFRTSDGGCTFETVFPGPADGDPGISALRAVAFGTGVEGMAVGTESAALFTRSAGKVWAIRNVGIPAGIVFNDVAARAAAAGPEYWAVGVGGAQSPAQGARVFRTNDNGTSWREVVPRPPAGAGATLESLVFVSANEAFVVGSEAGSPLAFRLTQPDTPVWTDVSPPTASPQPRGLLKVCSGIIRGTQRVFAVGQTGIVLQWNGSMFEGVPEIFEFDPQTGAIQVSKYHQNFTAAAIAPSIGRLYIGRDTTPDHTISQESGYFLLYDGLGWKEVKAQTNKDIRGISFIVEGPKVTAFVLGNASAENAVLDDGIFSDAVVLLHETH